LLLNLIFCEWRHELKTIKIESNSWLIIGAGFSSAFGLPTTRLLNDAICFFESEKTTGGFFENYPNTLWKDYYKSYSGYMDETALLNPGLDFEKYIIRLTTTAELIEYGTASGFEPLVNHYKRIVSLYLFKKTKEALEIEHVKQKAIELLKAAKTATIMTLNYDLILDTILADNISLLKLTGVPATLLHLHGTIEKWQKDKGQHFASLKSYDDLSAPQGKEIIENFDWLPELILPTGYKRGEPGFLHSCIQAAFAESQRDRHIYIIGCSMSQTENIVYGLLFNRLFVNSIRDHQITVISPEAISVAAKVTSELGIKCNLIEEPWQDLTYQSS